MKYHTTGIRHQTWILYTHRFIEWSRGNCRGIRLSHGFAWLDAGISISFQAVSAYIEAIERRQGIKIGCPEDAALAQQMLRCEYHEYLVAVADETRKLRG